MTVRTMKPLCVLSDANVIIKSHELDVWASLLTQCQMFTTEIIARNEALFFGRRKKFRIDLSSYISSGDLKVLSASTDDIDKLQEILSIEFCASSLHAGELEALALVGTGKVGDALFCTSDGPAIQALAALNVQNIGISFEELLKRTGFSEKRLEYRFTEAYFRKNLTEGKFMLIARERAIKQPQG
jgi:hypothetical protein